jgi:hypothetical protein
MIVQARRSTYTGKRLVRLPEDETRPPADIRRIDTTRTRKHQIDRWRELSDGIESAGQHSRLQAALMEYIWQERGAEARGIQESDGNDFSCSEWAIETTFEENRRCELRAAPTRTSPR